MGRLVPSSDESGLCLRCGCVLSGREPWASVSSELLRDSESGSSTSKLMETLWERHSKDHSVRYMTKWDFEQALNEAIQHLNRR